jgi:hypothetical protein
MEAAEIFVGSPGTDYTNGLVTIGGWLTDGTRQPNLTVNNYTRRVGIGTTSPSHKLDVNGDITGRGAFNGYASSTHNLLIDWSSESQVTTITATNLFFGTNAQRRMTILSGGNIGIGTSNPQYRLHVQDSANIGTIAIGNTSYPGLIYADAGSGEFRIDNRSSTSGFISFYPNGQTTVGNERMRIIANGNVGIGTTAPGQTLTIGQNTAGDTTAYSLAILRSGTSSSPGTWMSTPAITITDISGDGPSSVSNTNALLQLNLPRVADADTYSNNAFFINCVNDNGSAFVVTGKRNVGVGTTSPTSLFHVYNDSDIWHTRIGGASGELRIGGQTASGAVIQAYTPGGSIRDLYIQRDGGSVGIGTFSPTQKFSVEGGNVILNGANASANYYLLLNKKTGQDGGILFQRDNANDWQFVNNNSGNLLFYSYGTSTEAITFQRSSGNVGIGTTSPGSLLHVNGRSYIGTMTAYSHAVEIRGGYYGGPRLQIYGLDADSNGYMGLGTDMGGGPYELSIYSSNYAGYGIIRFGRFTGGNGTQYSGWTSTGLISTGGTLTMSGDVVAYGSPSDIKFKENVQPLEQGSLQKILKLRGVSFTWKEDTEMSKLTKLKDDIGFIAQEVQEVIPGIVRRDPVEDYLSIRDRGLLAIMVEAIKELKAQNDILQSRIEQLENK